MKKILLLVVIALLSPWIAQADPVVRMGYMPTIAFAQAFVIKAEGWDKQAGFDLDLQKIPGPSYLVQGFVANNQDMVYTVYPAC